MAVAIEVATKYDPKRKHGFLTRQSEGAAVFAHIPRDAPVVVVLSIWAYAHHVCGPLAMHKGPVLLLGNFDGTWPGLVSLLNHAATLERLNVKHSRLWTQDFAKDDTFMKQLARWVKTRRESNTTNHTSLTPQH